MLARWDLGGHTERVHPAFRLLPLAFAFAAPLWADVVHLRNGRALRGEIVRETGDAIVLRTPHGEIRLERATVERVEEESQADLFLGQARDAVRDQDFGTARQRFELALAELKAGPQRERVQAELKAVERRSDPFLPSSSSRGRWSEAGPDPFQREEPEARVRELMAGAETRPDLRQQLAQMLYVRGRSSYDARDFLSAAIDFGRAAEASEGSNRETLLRYAHESRLKVAAGAVRAGNAGLAARAARPVVESEREATLLRGSYLLGRAEELRQNRGAARTAYQQALSGIELPHSKLPLLRELARLRAAGSPVDPETAGVGKRWKWAQSAHFGVVHELDRSGPELTRILEAAFSDVVSRLKLKDVRGERIAVFLFADREGYQGSAGARGWTKAHASRLQGEDELVLSIYAFLGEGFESTLRHEIAHILTWRQLGDAVFPVWAGEGIAQFAEGEQEREQNRLLVRNLAAAGQLPDWNVALRQMLYPLQETQVALTAFYAQGGVMFEVLAQRIGPRKAIQALTRFNEEDAADVLRELGVGPQGFVAELQAIAAGR